MLRLTQNKGFTLVELAIVLVIIGIILGAVIKGQDLIDNARAKKFASEIKAWEIAVWNFFDRKGRLPGDNNKDGKIGDGNPFTDVDALQFQSPPNKSFSIGGNAFYVYLGSSGTTNYLIVCKNSTCNVTYSPDDPTDRSALTYFESFDAYTDGEADASQGNVRGLASVTITTNSSFTTLSLTATSSWLTSLRGMAMILR